MLCKAQVVALWMTLAGWNALAFAANAPPATQPAVALEPVPGWTAKVEAPGQRPQIRTTLVQQIPWRGNAQISFPNRPSSMMLVAEWGLNPACEVWDLSGPRKKATIRPKAGLDKPIVSPDGMYLVGIAKTGRNQPCIVEVWSLQVAQPTQPAQQLRVAEDNTWGADLIGFVGADQIAMVVNGSKTLEVWSVKTGQKVSSSAFDKRLDMKQSAMSPGGKYLAVFADGMLRVVDLLTGNSAGEAELPQGQGGGLANRPSPEAVAFSPDGREVAAFFTSFGQSRIVIWDFASGQVVGDLSVQDSAHPMYDGPALEWLPEGGGFLVYGVNIVERGAGQIIFKLDTATGQMSRRIMADNTHVIVTQRDLGKGFSLRAFVLPKDRLEKALAAVKAGGKIGDELLPPITKADLSGVLDVGVASPAGTEISPDPQPSRKFPSLAIRLKMSPPTALPPGTAKSMSTPTIHAFMISSPQAGQAAVVMSVHGSTKGVEVSRAWVERYNLAGGYLDSIELTPISVCADLSPDGKQILIRSADDRMDVFQFGGGPKGKHVAGWRPYESVAEKTGRQINFACFVDETHVLTRSMLGELICWEIPKCKAIWRVSVRPQQSPALSAGRAYIATALEEGMGVFDTKKGELLAKIDDSSGLGDIPVAFSPDGQRLALASEGEGLRVWDLKTGRIVNEFALPKEVASRRPMLWLGGAYIMMGGQYLVDIERRVVLWSYMNPGSGSASMMPDGRYWYIAPSELNRPPTIVAAALPHPEAQRLAGLLKPNDVLLIKPGTKVSLEISVGKDEGERQKVVDALTRQLKQNGMEIADGQPVHLVARVEAGKSETATYRAFMGGGGEQTVTVTQQISRLMFTIDGRTVWETQTISGGYAPSTIRLQEGQSAQQAVQGTGPGIGLYVSARLPKYVTKSIDEIGIGYSRLTAQGPVRTEPPMRNPNAPR